MVARTHDHVTMPAAPTDVEWGEVVRCVHRQMRSLVGPSRELEDLVQIALEQVLRSLDRFEGRSELSTFTYGVSVNVALRHFRSWRRFFRRFEIGSTDAVEPAATDADVGDDLFERERRRRLHLALDRISPMKRVTLVLADLEELPASKVAVILGIPEPTVRSRLRVARAELHTILRRDPFFTEEAR